jgi:hypothetical protein
LGSYFSFFNIQKYLGNVAFSLCSLSIPLIGC